MPRWTIATLAGLLMFTAGAAQAQTCADQHKACLARGHTIAECTKSTNSCLSTGRWIGPAGREFPISKRQ
jgi:hypothetical protein